MPQQFGGQWHHCLREDMDYRVPATMLSPIRKSRKVGHIVILRAIQYKDRLYFPISHDCEFAS